MMKTINNPRQEQWPELMLRPTLDYGELEPLVEEVFREVRLNGDRAVRKFTEKFDKTELSEAAVTLEEIEQAQQDIDPELKAAVLLAEDNIRKFHAAQATPAVHVETMEGVECWQEKKPIQKIGLYIPGGSAPLFSTILMLGVPAQIAGCQEIVLCTPPVREGKLSPIMLFAAQRCGISKIFKIGGIQAIAAMTFGTEKVPAVSKIFGPGNSYVTAAKQVATRYGISIDMPAGPSELLVLADETADPAFVAADLLSQAEHGSDSQVVLLSLNQEFLEEVKTQLTEQLKSLERSRIAGEALKNSCFIFMKERSSCLNFINSYAPEHLIISCKEEEYFVSGIQNAGSVFIGKYTPESAGDYASGTNHTLPTNAFAKQYSGVNLDSFLKAITFQRISSKGIRNIGPSIELMAQAEGLDAHKKAVSIRLTSILNETDE